MQLKINNITKSYGKKRALSEFTATLEPGIYAPTLTLTMLVSCGQNKNGGSPQDIFVTRSWRAPHF